MKKILILTTIVMLLMVPVAVSADSDGVVMARIGGTQDIGYRIVEGQSRIFAGFTLDYQLSSDAFVTLGLQGEQGKQFDILVDLSVNWYPSWPVLDGWFATAGVQWSPVRSTMLFLQLSKPF